MADISLCCQVLSRPLLALSIATLFPDLSKCSDGKSDCSTDSQDAVAYSELSPLQVDLNTGYIMLRFLMLISIVSFNSNIRLLLSTSEK